MTEHPPMISYEQIDGFLDGYNLAIRDHDGKSFALEVAAAQRSMNMRWFKQAGYVLLDEDQSLPLSGPYSLREAELVRQVRDAMLAANFKKIRR